MPKRPATGKLEENSRARGTRGTHQPSHPESDRSSMKVEAARALGLYKKVRKQGWGALTARESGAIGGYVRRVQAEARQRQDDA